MAVDEAALNGPLGVAQMSHSAANETGQALEQWTRLMAPGLTATTAVVGDAAHRCLGMQAVPYEGYVMSCVTSNPYIAPCIIVRVMPLYHKLMHTACRTVQNRHVCNRICFRAFGAMRL
jgi:hypothetical protein